MSKHRTISVSVPVDVVDWLAAGARDGETAEDVASTILIAAARSKQANTTARNVVTMVADLVGGIDEADALAHQLERRLMALE